jgi:isocitrate/isopropylmalate dehydrogenase
MLDWLGETVKSERLLKSIAQVIKEGKIKTYDLGGKNSSLEVAGEVARIYKDQ